MSKLISLIRKNNKLAYVDATTGIKHGFDDVCNAFLPQKEKKQLAFLYLNNDLDAISHFWRFMASKHAMALLSDDLKEGFKTSLEAIYQPTFIYDNKRTEIAGYTLETLEKGRLYRVFRRNTEGSSSAIHPDLKVLLSTSGTTGSPKFVKLSEVNILENALSIVDYLPIKNTDVTPLNLPIYYSYGLSVLTSNALKGGESVCGLKDVLSKEFWADFEKFGFTSLAGVPYVYELLFRTGFTKRQYPTLRYITQAGGKLNDNLIKTFYEFAQANNVKFYVMYGQTEATARISYLPPQYLMEKLGSIGKPIKNGTFTIDAESNELLYSGPNVFGGYVEKAADLAAFDQQTTLHTGDTARIDEDGFCYITGRLKRMIKIFGSRVNLDEVENLLKNKFNQSFACIGLNDKHLCLFYTAAEIDAKEVSSYLFEQVSIHPTAIKQKVINAFPLTSNGKVSYAELAQNQE